MTRILRGLAAAGLALCAAGAWAQSTPTQGPTPVKTGKERLGDKASDEQRVDNCKVAPDRRGPRPRPDGCARDGR
ncbi:hypothetical protein KXS07_21395 [Inquilinus limosus]|uniref:hypothetical protein n=1 Tax=Inquilinus limosus TaxID=171674 RepID=UPI003F17F30C